MENKKLREILSKKPFIRVSPLGRSYSTEEAEIGEVVTQADFLREYYPSGHKINDPIYYPDKIKIDPETGKYYEEKVVRYAAPHQFVIATKQIVHLCGNDVRMELASGDSSEVEQELFAEVRKGWHIKHSEQAFYKLVSSVKITGDGAIVGVMNNGKFHWKWLSFLEGDNLYAHEDDFGYPYLFAREYRAYDNEGKTTQTFVEVWDDKYYTRYKRSNSAIGEVYHTILKTFGLSGYTIDISPTAHGFSFCPVAYHRESSGACWSIVQGSCDQYDLAVSHMCQNNMAYAFPIMFLKGTGLEITGGENMYAPVKAITGGEDSNVSFLDAPNGTSLFELQLKILLQNIYQGSFTVLPPEVRSGDLPGVAVKLLYSPAVEKAMVDAMAMDKVIRRMLDIFLQGYGMEIGKMTPMRNLEIFTWIEPYIHQNIAELIDNLSKGVQNSFISRKTASELTPYGATDELYRLIKQQKEDNANILPDELNFFNNGQEPTNSSKE